MQTRRSAAPGLGRGRTIHRAAGSDVIDDTHHPIPRESSPTADQRALTLGAPIDARDRGPRVASTTQPTTVSFVVMAQNAGKALFLRNIPTQLVREAKATAARRGET